MDHRVDEIDKRVLYHLSRDARNTTAADVAEEMDVTPATIRNRIHQLEAAGILRGYLADVNYKAIEGHVTYQFSCTAPIPERDRLAQAALDVSGVVSVRELMTGKTNLAVTAVGSNTDDISRIAGELSDAGLEIEDESVVENEYHQPYNPFGPDDVPVGPSLTDFMSLAGGAEVVEFTVSEGADVAGLTIEQAVEDGLLADEMLVVGIERDGGVLTPKGETVIRTGDVVSLFSKSTLERDALEVFGTQ
ncbi:Lrp/AsnC family transcriptional regulator [Halobacterium jilantaiense]|uniref:DNA-binding transcriptional regulator, Lrp family n=1 Tax=Halobacterium jilantaiense TaxID=355548 RepID=A0A1I0PFF2_9EURY|nr:Lrp/AsnC family transcriptional regulator [Halobacterium jilantaiense]SEW13153.1 DNA-binding transcriptional regulator, Lrp family [Halobacterium jilantaiense]